MLTTYFARVLSLLTHFELGNQGVMRSHLKTFAENFKDTKTNVSFVVGLIEEDSKKTLTPAEYNKALKRVYNETKTILDKEKEIEKMTENLYQLVFYNIQLILYVCVHYDKNIQTYSACFRNKVGTKA